MGISLLAYQGLSVFHGSTMKSLMIRLYESLDTV